MDQRKPSIIMCSRTSFSSGPLGKIGWVTHPMKPNCCPSVDGNTREILVTACKEKIDKKPNVLSKTRCKLYTTEQTKQCAILSDLHHVHQLSSFFHNGMFIYIHILFLSVTPWISINTIAQVTPNLPKTEISRRSCSLDIPKSILECKTSSTSIYTNLCNYSYVDTNIKWLGQSSPNSCDLIVSEVVKCMYLGIVISHFGIFW